MALAQTIVSLPDPSLRRAFVVERFVVDDPSSTAVAVDALMLDAEQGDEAAKEALIAVVDAVQVLGSDATSVQRLREEAAGHGLVALDRLLRIPAAATTASPSRPSAAMQGIRNESGRPLTLGERKSLAKRPDRNLLERLLADPHPDVIRGVLKNPRLTEDDVVRFVARVPSRPELLGQVARSPEWVHRPRVRLALVLNPFTSPAHSVPLTGLLLRHELRLVVESTTTPLVVRAACMEHLARKYPRGVSHDSIQ
jgi:hypothetical protein